MPVRRLLRLLVGLVTLVLLAGFGTAAPAAAHAGLVSTDPASGTVLDTAPRDLRLIFSEPVAPVAEAFTLYDSSGRYAGSDGGQGRVPVTSLDTTVTALLPPSLPNGSYLLSWRVVSADSHPIGGVLPFAVGETSAAPPAPPPADAESLGNPVNSLYLALQVLGYLALLGAAGLSVFDQVVLVREPGRPRTRRRLLALGVGLSVAAYTLLLPLTVLRERGEGLSRLGGAGPWREGWSTPAAATLALAAAGGLLLLLAARLPAAAGRLVGLLGGLVAVASVLPTGHTRTYGPAWLVVTLDLVHAATAAIWFGGLIGLGLHLARARRSHSDPVPVAAVVARFSALAGALVGLLGASGLGMAVIILGSVSALFDTSYGRALLVKLALVAVIGLLAVWNKAYLVKAVRRRNAPAAQWRRLRGAVLDEAALLVVALAITGLLTMQSPTEPLTFPDSSTAGPAVPGSERVSFGDGSLQGQLLPARVGPNTLEFTLRDGDGAPLASKVLPEVSASLPSEGLGPLEASVEKLAGTSSRYQAELQLPLGGEWQLVVSLPSTSFDAPTGTLVVLVTG